MNDRDVAKVAAGQEDGWPSDGGPHDFEELIRPSAYGKLSRRWKMSFPVSNGARANAPSAPIWRKPMDELRSTTIEQLAALAEPIAWRFEVANAKDAKGYCGWEWRLSEREPCCPADSVRNLTPLYALPELLVMAEENARMRGALEAICDRDKFVAEGPARLLRIARSALAADEGGKW